jgi:hypothetical protein
VVPPPAAGGPPPPGRTIAISDGVLSERIEAGHA